MLFTNTCTSDLKHLSAFLKHLNSLYLGHITEFETKIFTFILACKQVILFTIFHKNYPSCMVIDFSWSNISHLIFCHIGLNCIHPNCFVTFSWPLQSQRRGGGGHMLYLGVGVRSWLKFLVQVPYLSLFTEFDLVWLSEWKYRPWNQLLHHTVAERLTWNAERFTRSATLLGFFPAMLNCLNETLNG